MKIKCMKCGKNVDESKIIKSGWSYFCSDKCHKNFWLDYKKLWRNALIWTFGIIGIMLLIMFILLR